MTADPVAAFAYTAQGPGGEPVSGTINAVSVTQASQKLQLMQLRLIELDPARETKITPRKLSADDFQTFNNQLAYLATAGLPIEKSLRLIAEDMRTASQAQAVRQIAADLESGQSLPESFAHHAKQFPPLYSELVAAGIRSGNLSGMLLGLSRHLDLTRRLRNILWQAIAYPLMVLLSLLAVLSFLSIVVFPQFKFIFNSFQVELPVITQIMLSFSSFMVQDWPILLGLLLAGIFLPPLIIQQVRPPLFRQRIKEILLTPIPLIGPAIRRNLLARWCDALKLGIVAGLDLPLAITLAGQAVGSPRLIDDGQAIVDAINAGQPLDENIKTRWIPQTVIVVLAMASATNDLPGGLSTLSTLFQQQAEMRLTALPAVLTPILIILIASVICFVVLAMFAPFFSLISAVSGPHK
jgi:type II secretory pathway component PulF